MFPFNIEIILSEDGSTTLFRPDLNEHYHSVHGAIQESMHVFIDAGLKKCNSESLKILEIGFGTGLNALLTMLNAENKQIVYHAIEKYPLSDDVIEKINYPDKIGAKYSAVIFNKIHKTPWNEEHKIEESFILKKIKADLLEHQFEKGYDLVYFDAFAPEKQPELWDREIFQKLFDSMSANSILTTYCSKGSVRRSMIECGFKVLRIDGPPGKRQMIVALKDYKNTTIYNISITLI